MNVYDIIDMPENMEGMKKQYERLGMGESTDNEIRTALLVLADSANEYEPDDAEIDSRIARYKANPKSTLALNVLISGLCYKMLKYAVNRLKGDQSILVRRTGEKRNDALIVYTSEKATNVPSLDKLTFYDTDLDGALDICEENEIRFILLNPETDRVKISVASIRDALDTFYDIDEHISTVLELGVSGEDLFPELLEYLALDHVNVTMQDDTKLEGIVVPWRRDRPVMEQDLAVRTKSAEYIHIRPADIKSISLIVDESVC